MRRLFLFLCLSLFFKVASATVEFCVGANEAFKTIQAAVDAVPAILDEPYVITVRGGTYAESVLIEGKGTTAQNHLTLRGARRAMPILDPRGENRHCLVLKNQRHVRIEWMVFSDSGAYANVVLSGARYNTIANCVFVGNRGIAGLSLSSSRDNHVEASSFCGNAQAGVLLVNTSRSNTIRFNVFDRNAVGVRMDETYSSEPVLENHNAFSGGRPVQGFTMGSGSMTTSVALLARDGSGRLLAGQSLVTRWGLGAEATEGSPSPISTPSEGGAGEYFIVDLARFANRSLRGGGDSTEGWTGQGDYDLRHLPKGRQVFDGIPYALPSSDLEKSVLVLKGKSTPGFPADSGLLPVGRKVDALHFLHTSAWAVGDVLFDYVVRYADGGEITVPVHKGVQVNDWWNALPVTDARLVWKAPHPLHRQVEFGIYAYAWINPYPHREIAGVRMVSAGEATPILLALTGENIAEDALPRVNLFTAQSQHAEASRPVLLSLDCSAETVARAVARVDIFSEDGRLVETLPPRPIRLDDGLGERLDFEWTPPATEATATYRCMGIVSVAGREVESSPLYLRVPGTRPAPPTLDAGNLLYSCEIQPRQRTLEGRPREMADPRIFDQLKANGGSVAHLILWWSYLEPEPFVYDFSSIDWALEQCRRVGLKASLSLWMADHVVPAFVADENMIDQFGDPMLAERGRVKNPTIMPSLWGPKTREHYARLIQEICRRYLDDEDVSAWAFMYQHTEVSLHDRPGSPPLIYDYSEWSQQHYRGYLREVRGFSLEALRARYGMGIPSWDALRQPLPTDGLDVSLRWSDFQDYRVYSIREAFRFTFEQVRKVDPSGRKMLWTFNPDYAEDVCDEFGVMPNYTSSEAPKELDRFLASQVSGRRPFLVEPTTIPPGEYEIGAGFFNALTGGASAGYFWIGTGKRMFPTDTPAAGAYRRYRDAWVEIGGADIPSPDIAILRGEDTALAIDKVSFNYPRTWTNSNYDWLIRRLQFGHHVYQPIYDSFFRMAGNRFPREYKLVIDTDTRVMTSALMDELVRQLENGATLVLQPESGRYCRENAVPDRSLMSRLGWSAAASANWRPGAAGSVAKMADGGALFAGCALSFRNRYPIDQLKGGDLLRANDGSPVARIKNVGRGRVVLLAGDPDWKAASAFEALDSMAGAAGVVRPLSASHAVRASIVRKAGAFYILLFNENGARFVRDTIKISLPKGAYRLKVVTDGFSDGGSLTSEAARSGFPVILSPNEFRAYKLYPEPPVRPGHE